MKYLLTICAHIMMVTGIIGIFIPLLPTTPFLLLAAYLYSKSNSKFYNVIISHKHLGPPIKEWQDSGVINVKAKILATVMILLIAVFKIPTLPLSLYLFYSVETILVGLVIFILTRPGLKKS